MEIRIFAERRIFLKHVAPVGRGNFACNGIGERGFRMFGICNVVRARKKRFRLIARAARNIRNALLRGNASECIVEGKKLFVRAHIFPRSGIRDERTRYDGKAALALRRCRQFFRGGTRRGHVLCQIFPVSVAERNHFSSDKIGRLFFTEIRKSGRKTLDLFHGDRMPGTVVCRRNRCRRIGSTLVGAESGKHTKRYRSGEDNFFYDMFHLF